MHERASAKPLDFGLYIAATGIGLVAGLRCLTAPALVCGAAWLGFLKLTDTPLSFLASPTTTIIVLVLALGELIGDKLPKTPARTALPGLAGRILTGAISAAALCASSGGSLATGAILGIIGALIGCFGGYYARTGLVKALKVKDAFVAVPEDILAIGLGCLFISLAI